MQEKMIELSAKGLGRITVDRLEDNFTFIVSKHSWKCNAIIAEFLSPKVTRLRSKDSSILTLQLETEDEDNAFECMMNLAHGKQIVVTEQNKNALYQFATELENIEILDMLLGQLSIENCVKWLIARQGYQSAGIIQFVSEHFYELPGEELQALDCDSLHSVLSNPSLRVESEDLILEFLMTYVSEHRNGFDLFGFVEFKYVSRRMLWNFFEFWKTFQIEVNEKLISSIQERVFLGMSTARSSPRHHSNMVSPYHLALNQSVFQRRSSALALTCSAPFAFFTHPLLDGCSKKFLSFDNPFSGIIDHLTQRCGGNVIDHHIIDMIYSNEPVSCYKAKTIADLGADSDFYTSSQADSYVGYDFKSTRIFPVAYTLQGPNVNYGGQPRTHLKSWVLQISNDNKSWITIDERTDNYDLKGRHLFHTYAIRNDNVFMCRFIRIKQTGQNHSGTLNLGLSSFEIFGGIE